MEDFTEVGMQIEAGDDLGLLRTGIVYKVGANEPVVLWDSTYDDRPESRLEQAVLYLEDQSLSFQDTSANRGGRPPSCGLSTSGRISASTNSRTANAAPATASRSRWKS
jgi:hypothetical protein